jgi:hypothetical protein
MQDDLPTIFSFQENTYAEHAELGTQLADNELEKNSLLKYEQILYLKIQDFCDITLCCLV